MEFPRSHRPNLPIPILPTIRLLTRPPAIRQQRHPPNLNHKVIQDRLIRRLAARPHRAPRGIRHPECNPDPTIAQRASLRRNDRRRLNRAGSIADHDAPVGDQASKPVATFFVVWFDNPTQGLRPPTEKLFGWSDSRLPLRLVRSGSPLLLLEPEIMVLLGPVNIDGAASHRFERTFHTYGADIDVTDHGSDE